MGKYAPLADRLAINPQAPITMAFDDIDSLVDGGLPPSARRYPGWWSNNDQGHVHARAWLDHGRRVVSVDLAGEVVTFGAAGQ